MNALELIKFLGHSSVYAEFNDFLTQHDVNNRPKISRALDTIIAIQGQGLSMSFDIDAEASGITPKSGEHLYLANLKYDYLAMKRKTAFILAHSPMSSKQMTVEKLL